MSVEAPSGAFILCYDGSEGAERAMRIAPVVLGEVDARALVEDGVAFAALGSVSREVVNAYHRPVVLV